MTGGGHLFGDPGDGERHPDDALVLRQSRSVRGYHGLEGLKPFGMAVEQTMPASAAPADAAFLRNIAGVDLPDRFVKSVLAYSDKFTDFVHAALTKRKSLGSGIVSSLVFVERGHKRQLVCCKHFWRRLRKHFQTLGVMFEVTKISPVLQIYLLDNQVFNYKSYGFFGWLEASSGDSFVTGGMTAKKFMLFFNVYLSRGFCQAQPIEGLLHRPDPIVVVYHVPDQFERVTGRELRDDVYYFHDQPPDPLGDRKFDSLT